MDQSNGSNGQPSTPPPAPPVAPPPAPPADSTPQGGTSGNRTLMIILAYLGLLALIPLLMEKEDRDLQWHAKHGLVLMVAEIVFFIVLQIVTIIAGKILGVLGCVFGIILLLACLGVLVFHILCIVKGIKGERMLVPGISEFADRF